MRKKLLRLFLLFLFSVHVTGHILGQQNKKVVDLVAQADAGKMFSGNKHFFSVGDEGSLYVYPDAGEGVVWFSEHDLKTGMIEFDILMSIDTQNIAGFAFGGSPDDSFEIIRFKNFQNSSQLQPSSTVQYAIATSHEATSKLISASVDNISLIPGKWFHVRISINKTSVDVFINYNSVSSFSCQRNNNKGDKIGFWLGHQSSGEFKNLFIGLMP